jgi:hypothetical protein
MIRRRFNRSLAHQVSAGAEGGSGFSSERKDWRTIPLQRGFYKRAVFSYEKVVDLLYNFFNLIPKEVRDSDYLILLCPVR